MEPEENGSPTDVEWEHRILCSDGSCIGVIGPDGRCKECGLAYEGQLPWLGTNGPGNGAVKAEKGAVSGTETEGAIFEDSEDIADSLDDWEEEDAEATDDEWERRVLCSDESCIGVIGPDGRCKECGKPLSEP